MDTQSVIDRFKAYLERRAPGRRTSVDYVSDVRQFVAVCTKAWREITLHDIDTFVDQQRADGLSGATIKRRVAALKVFFDFLAEESDDLAWPNPVRFKRHAGKPGRRLPRHLPDEQIAQLWAVITCLRDRAWFALMLRAGLRVGEVVRLQLNDILSPPSADQPARIRVCGKGQKERVVLLTADAYDVLSAWLGTRPESEQPYVFLNERQQPLQASGLQWLLQRYGQQIGLHVSPHQLRHTYAHQLTEQGMPLSSLSHLLGHAQVSTTQIYTAGADPGLQQAYQQAMAQLKPPPTEPPFPALPVQPEPNPHPPAEPAQAAPLPDWQQWLPELPAELRQASLQLVQRRLPAWKAELRRRNALHALGELRRFWQWLLAQRPVEHWVDIHLADLQAYQASHIQAAHAARTVNRALVWPLALLQEQAELGRPIDPAVLRLKRLATPDSLPRHLSEAQSQQLEAYVAQRLDQTDPLIRLENACFFVLAHTGLRVSECAYLQGRDLDLEGQRLFVRQGKGQRDRWVYLSQTATQAIRRYLNGRHPSSMPRLWLRPNQQPVTPDWLYGRIVALGQAAGVADLSPHRLRHTLATRLLNHGMDVTRIQKLLGHEHLSTTQIYARVLDHTVEADYHQAMRRLERQQTPWSDTPELVKNWPIQPFVQPVGSSREVENAV